MSKTTPKKKPDLFDSTVLLNQVMTTAEAAAYLEGKGALIAERSIRDAAQTNRIPARKSGGTWIVVKKDVDSYFARHIPVTRPDPATRGENNTLFDLLIPGAPLRGIDPANTDIWVMPLPGGMIGEYSRAMLIPKGEAGFEYFRRLCGYSEGLYYVLWVSAQLDTGKPIKREYTAEGITDLVNLANSTPDSEDLDQAMKSIEDNA